MENYNWKRFWSLNGENLQLDYGGFLPNPENKNEQDYYYNPNLVSLNDISHIPCLILFGEAGMGKSTTMKAEYEKTELEIEELEDVCLWFDLRYSANNSSSKFVFNHPTFKTWEKGTHKLYLFLDSLDEGLLAFNTLNCILEQEIDKSLCNRLYLRITCRTADWKNSLTEAFERKWGNDNVKTYNLCPLRRKDVEEALKHEKIDDTQAFFKELFNKEITTFATQPITLKFLIDIYQKNQQFPDSKTGLYYTGCLELCKEKNIDRLDCGFKGKLSDQQRLIVAGRIAMMIIFANKVAIWKHYDSTLKPDSDITIDQLCVGQETINQQEFNVTRECIEEVLSISGLFSSKGEDRLGFAHKTYAEFLAAWYLNEHKISLPQIMNLIIAPEDTEGKLIPQLHQTCAWLSSLRKDVLERIIEKDPDVVLDGDISDNNDLKTKIVDKLLKLYDQEKLHDPYFPNSPYYHRLKHSQLAEQLRSYIKDKNKSLNFRQQAVNIARYCNVIELQGDLIQLTLDNSEPIDLRINSCICICTSVIGDRQARAKLKPLIFEDLPEDTRDNLKCYVLEALWTKEHPDLTAQELFSALTPPKQNCFIGSYHTFISHKLIKNLETKDLIFALDWVKKLGVRNYLKQSIKIRYYLADEILLKAWRNFDNPETIKRFAQITLIQWNDHEDLITNNENNNLLKRELHEDENKRHKLINRFVLEVNEYHVSQLQYFYHILLTIPKLLKNRKFLLLKFCFYNLIHKRPRYINNIGREFGYLFYGNSNRDKVSLEKNILWLIKKIRETEDDSIQASYIDLAVYNFCPILYQNVELTDALCSLYYFYKKDNGNPNSIFIDKFSKYIEPIDLNCEQAKKQKSNYDEVQEIEENREYNEPLESFYSRTLSICLDKFESSHLDCWHELCTQINVFPNSKYYDHYFKLNLMELPGWKNSDQSIKQRIIECAKKYVLEKQDLNCDWIGTNKVDLLPIAGCKALYLLLKIEPDFVNQLAPHVWQKWASIIIAYPNYSDIDRDESYLELVYLTYSNAQTESIDTLLKLIDRENIEYQCLYIIHKFEKCWDDQLKSIIFDKITQNQDILKPKSLEQLCQQLIQHNYLEVIKFIKLFIKTFSPSSNQIEKDKIFIAIKLLINNTLSQRSGFRKLGINLANYSTRYSIWT